MFTSLPAGNGEKLSNKVEGERLTFTVTGPFRFFHISISSVSIPTQSDSKLTVSPQRLFSEEGTNKRSVLGINYLPPNFPFQV